MTPRICFSLLFCFACFFQRAVASDTVVVKKMKDLDSISVLAHALIWQEGKDKPEWPEVMNQPFLRKPN